MIKLPMSVDWPLLIMRLKTKVGTHQQLAEASGVSKPSLEGYLSKRARIPSYETGAKLINLYAEHYLVMPIKRSNNQEK